LRPRSGQRHAGHPSFRSAPTAHTSGFGRRQLRQRGPLPAPDRRGAPPPGTAPARRLARGGLQSRSRSSACGVVAAAPPSPERAQGGAFPIWRASGRAPAPAPDCGPHGRGDCGGWRRAGRRSAAIPARNRRRASRSPAGPGRWSGCAKGRWHG